MIRFMLFLLEIVMRRWEIVKDDWKMRDVFVDGKVLRRILAVLG